MAESAWYGWGSAVIVVLLLVSTVFGMFRRRQPIRARKRIHARRVAGTHRFGTAEATSKQMKLLASLVEQQNFFRAKPILFEDWIRSKSKSGFISVPYASDLIQQMILEVEELNYQFEKQKRRPEIGKFRGQIFVSDFNDYGFCERAAYFATHQFPNQNILTLGNGSRTHESFSSSSTRDASKPARVFNYIKQSEPAVSRVEWLPNSKENVLRHPSLPVSGRPDGFIHFEDGTVAVIELKTVATLPKQAYESHFQQVEVYALLASRQSRVSDDCFVLYQDRSNRELALHKRRRRMTEYRLAEKVAKLERGSRSISELKTAKSEAQCRSCGYRAVCGTRAG